MRFSSEESVVAKLLTFAGRIKIQYGKCESSWRSSPGDLWLAPSYNLVWQICSKLDERLKVLAHAGDPEYEQNYDILIRREAERPNEIWQCDHKELKVWAIDEFGNIGKVWLTAIIDDYSRVVPGYFLDVRRPNSMKIASALRQAIWFKNDQKWTVCGIPDVFYSDHGRDFKSTHIAQAAADLVIKLV